MRLPTTPQLSTKDGVNNKNARLTNALKESSRLGDKAVVRPGLALSTTYSGVGNGLIPFDGRLLVIADETVYIDNEGDEFPLDSPEWDSGTTYAEGDVVWYGDISLWFSLVSANVGNTPGAGAYWARSYNYYEWTVNKSYALGARVISGGATYYSWTGSNIGNTPASSPLAWKTTAPNLNLTIGTVSYSSNIDLPGSQTASWTIYDGGTPVGSGAGSLTTTLADGIATLTASNWPREATTNLGSIAVYVAMPSTPPYWAFSGSTQWSGLPGWDNFSWSPTQSGGSWYVIGGY